MSVPESICRSCDVHSPRLDCPFPYCIDGMGRELGEAGRVLRARVLDYATTAGGATVVEAARQLGISGRNAYRDLRKLRNTKGGKRE